MSKISKFAGAFVVSTTICLWCEPALALTDSLVDHTYWCVSNLEGGNKDVAHPMPWTFEKNGRLFAGDLWQGVWSSKSSDRISAVIVFDGDVSDNFDVQFISDEIFIAWKGNKTYRWGQKTLGENCR